MLRRMKEIADLEQSMPRNAATSKSSPTVRATLSKASTAIVSIMAEKARLKERHSPHNPITLFANRIESREQKSVNSVKQSVRFLADFESIYGFECVLQSDRDPAYQREHEAPSIVIYAEIERQANQEQLVLDEAGRR